MTISNYILWFAETAAFLALLFLCRVPLKKKERAVPRAVVFVLKILMMIVSALLFVAVESVLAYRFGREITALYAALVGDILATMTEFFIRGIMRKKDDDRPCMIKTAGVLSIIFCACFMICGIINSQTVMQNTHEITLNGLTKSHTFAFVADIHAGYAQTPDVLDELCRQINAADPEFVILGGDVTDELTSRDDMFDTYRRLSAIDAPVYYVYGNHDRQPSADFFDGRTYSDEELKAAIEDAGMRILSDECVDISDDLALLGREDISRTDERKPWSEVLSEYNGDGALIVADHQPFDTEQLADGTADLQLSGHTHAGQLFPLQLVYRAAGIRAFGEFFDETGTPLLVTSGESVWMMPLRTEAHCEWELVVLKNE